MKKFLLFLVLASFLSCDEKPQAQAAVETETASLSDTLQVQTNRQVTLQPEAQEKVSDWLAYATAHNQVEDMRSATGRDLVSNSQPVVQIMEALSSSLPDSLQQVPVRARISVLVTKANGSRIGKLHLPDENSPDGSGVVPLPFPELKVAPALL